MVKIAAARVTALTRSLGAEFGSDIGHSTAILSLAYCSYRGASVAGD